MNFALIFNGLASNNAGFKAYLPIKNPSQPLDLQSPNSLVALCCGLRLKAEALSIHVTSD